MYKPIAIEKELHAVLVLVGMLATEKSHNGHNGPYTIVLYLAFI